MKTKELIERLQKVDPTGELECVADNADIYFASIEPMYYDGIPKLLVHDPKIRAEGFYSVVGFRVPDGGQKVQIRTMTFQDALIDDPEIPIHYDNESYRERCAPGIEKIRAEYRIMVAEIKAGAK